MYHIVPLTGEQIRTGILLQIGDALSDAFTNSAKAVTERGLRGDKEEMVIFFDNSSTNPNFWDNHGEDVQDVLYVNDAAKDAAERAGVKFTVTGTTNDAPAGRGLMSRMYRFVNLR
jgi:hypothetical protein